MKQLMLTITTASSSSPPPFSSSFYLRLWRLPFLLLLIFCFGKVGFSLNSSYITFLRSTWEKKCISHNQNAIYDDMNADRGVLKKGCVVFYLHNHKTGGSTVCHTAFSSGFGITSLEDNCNLPSNIVSEDRLNRGGIAQNYVLTHPSLSFVAQELPPFLPNITNDRYIYITTIRNPIDRLLSHMHHGLCTVRTQKNAFEYLMKHNCSIRDIRAMTLSDLVLDKCFRNEMLWLSSNYYVSMFTGCTMRKKSGILKQNMCNETHLEIAKNKLHFFSVIMITDTPEDYKLYSALLDLKLSMKFKDENRRGTYENTKAKSFSLRQNYSAWEVISKLNSLDIEFFEYAKELAASLLHGGSGIVNYKDLRRLQNARGKKYNTLSTGNQQVHKIEMPFCRAFKSA